MNRSDSLAWLRTHDGKRAATYDPTDGTVQCWRKRYSRRRDGTIRGYHDDPKGAWESYRVDVCAYVAKAKPRHDRRVANVTRGCAEHAADFRTHAAAAAANRAAMQTPGLPPVAVQACRRAYRDALRSMADAVRGYQTLRGAL